MTESLTPGIRGLSPADPDFERRTRASFARAGRTITVCRFDAWVDKGGRRVHCAAGTQTLMSLAGRAGVRD